MADTIISIGGDTSLLERQIQDALSKNFKLTGLDTKSFTQPLGRIKGQLGEFEKSLEASNARVVAFGASAGAIYYLQDALKGLVNSTIQVEKTLADINTVLDASESGIKSFGNELFNVANKTSQAFETAAGAALEFSRQGLGLEETLKRTSDALTLAKISGLSAADSVEALTAAINSFSDSGLTAAQIVNKLAAVDARYAVSSADLAEAIKRVGSTAAEAGISIDQLIGLVTSAQQTTARGGAVIGNSFKTIFTRLQRPKVLESLEEIGIQTQSVTGETLPLIQVLTQLAAKFDSLSSAQKSQVAELVGGVYQINILKAVIGDLSKEYSTYSGALRASAGASNEAERRVASLTQTLDSQINRVTNNLKRAGSVIGELTIAPALEKVLSGANAVLESFALGKEPQSFGEKAATGFLKGLGTFLSGPGLLLGAAAVFQIFKRLASFVGDAGRTILGLGQAAQQQAQIQAQILQILQKNPAVYNQIASGAISVESAAAGYLKIVQATNAELERQKILSGQIAASILSGGGGVSGGTGGRKKGKAAGFIPNFAMSGPMAEMDGAARHKGGYKAGMPYVTQIHDGKGGSFKSWVNSAETVKTFTNAAGHKATVVRPPNGFGPGTEVAAAGFIPNFAKKLNVKGVDAGARGKEFEKLINYYLINERTTAGTALLDFPYPTNSLTTASPANKAKIALNSASVFGDAKIKSASYSRKDLIKKLVGSLSQDDYKKLLNQAEYGKGNFINLNRFLPAIPSLISSKNTITPDNVNATASAELGEDVILNLARLYKNPETHKLTEQGFHKRLLLNYIEDYVTIPNFNSGFIPNFAAGDGSISLGQYAAKKGSLVTSLKAAALNAAYQAGVSADEIRAINPKWQFKGATEQEQTRRAISAQQKAETFKKEFAYNNKPIKEIVVPWNKTISDFGGDPSRFGDAYEEYANAFLRGKYGKRYKTAVELGLPGTRTKGGELVGRNFARVEGAIFDKNLQEVMMWIELKALSEQNKLSYRRSDVANKFANIGYGGKVAKGARGLVLRSRAAGFIPNFAPVTGGNFYDFDETISVYPHDINPKELFYPESVKKAKLSPLGRSLQGSKTPINVLTARGNNSKKAITQFLIDNNIPVNKVITSAGMFKNVKVPGTRKAERGLTSAEKKATFLSRLFAKTGVPSRLIDDAPANISAIQALKNPNISAELYSVEGQRGLGQQFKFGGFIPNFAKLNKSSSNLQVFRGVNPKFGDTNKGVNSIGVQHKLVAVLGRGNFSENPAIAKSYGSKLLTSNVDESKLLNLQSYNDIMGLYQKYVPEYAAKIKNSQGAQQFAIITEAGKLLSKKLKAQGYSGIRSPLGGGDKKYLNEEKGLSGNLIIPLASGFVPNFNALNEAVKREKAAGFSASQVKVGQSDSLKSSFNPQGLGVYNTVQEPGGLSQGMGFARKAGINPKTKGMSSGFIPNFAFSFGFSEEEYFKANLGGDSGEARKKAEESYRNRQKEAAERKAKQEAKNKEKLAKLRSLRERPGTAGEGAAAAAKEAQFAERMARERAQEEARQQDIKQRSDEVRARMASRLGGSDDSAKSYEATQKSIRRNQEKEAKRAAAAARAATSKNAGGGGTSRAGKGIGGSSQGGLMKGFLLNQLISTGSQFLPEEYQGIAEKAGSLASTYYTVQELAGTRLGGKIAGKFKGSAIGKGIGKIGKGFGAVGKRVAGSAIGRGAGALAGAAAGPLLAAYAVGQAGQAGIDYFGGFQGGIGGTRKEGQERKNLDKELNKYKTESGKALASYNQMSRAKTGAFGETTGEKVSYGLGGIGSFLGFGTTEELKKFNFGAQRKEAAGVLAEGIGGIGNAKKLLEQTGGGKSKEDVNKFTEALFKSLKDQGKETGGLDFNQKDFEELNKRNMQAENGVAGVKALNDEEKKLLETYKAAKDAAGQLIKDVKQMEKVKALQATFKDVASAMASSGAKATAMLQIYKQVQEKEKQRGETLKKNYGGGVDAFMNPEKSMGSMDKIQQALKTLNDPRLAGNAVERGRAAARYMEGTTELGINLPKGAQAQLSGLVETGLTTFNERNLNTIGAIGGQFRNNFGIQQGITESRVAMGALAKQSGLTTSQRQLTENDAMAGIGYRNPQEMQAMNMTDKQVQALEKTQQAVTESIAKLSALAEAAAKGQISPEQFNEAAAALKRAAESNQTNSKDMAAQLEAVFNTLPDKLKGIAETSATKIQTETSVTGGVKLELSEDAKRLLVNANEIIALNKNNTPSETASGTKTPVEYNKFRGVGRTGGV